MASGDKIYEQLNTLKLSDVSATNISTVTKPLHIQKTNQDALATTVQINRATMRDGSPMPGYGKVVQTTGDADRIQFQPEVGEVWLFQSGDILRTDGTFSVNFQLRDADGNIAYIGTASTTGQEAISGDLAIETPFYVTNTLYMYADLTSGEGRLSTAFVRVR